MNKTDFAAKIAERTGLTKAQAVDAIDAFTAIATEALKAGDDVRLLGFGNFSAKEKAASVGRNPATGAEIQIPARLVPKFTPGKGLKDALN